MNQLWSFYYNSALDNINLNKIDSSIRDLKISLSHSKNYFTYNILGLCYFRKGLLLESFNAFEKSLEIYDSEETKKYLKIIELNLDTIKNKWAEINNFLDNKNYKQALKLITNSNLKSKLDNTEYYNIFTGLIYYKCKKTKKARFHWKKAYKINGENTDTLKYLYQTQSIKDIFMKHFNIDWSFM